MRPGKRPRFPQHVAQTGDTSRISPANKNGRLLAAVGVELPEAGAVRARGEETNSGQVVVGLLVSGARSFAGSVAIESDRCEKRDWVVNRRRVTGSISLGITRNGTIRTWTTRSSNRPIMLGSAKARSKSRSGSVACCDTTIATPRCLIRVRAFIAVSDSSAR